MEWHNWDGRIRCRPAEYLTPLDEDALCEHVARGNRHGRTVRVAGSGHSFTPLAATDDILVSLEKLRGVIDVDRDRNVVDVWAGTPLHQLGRELSALGLAQENLGDIDAQTLAGATATGTHGTGAAFGSISTQIEGFTLITADGELRHCDAASDRALFDAGRLSLGSLGILSRIRLRVVPDYRLHLRVRHGALDHCLDHAQGYADSHRNFEFYWFPHTRHTLMKFSDATAAAARPRPPWKRLVDDAMETGVFGTMSRLARALPVLSPAVAEAAGRFVGTADVVDAAHRIYPTPRRVRFHEMEYALPQSALIPALMAVRERIARARYAVFFPLECRFAAADDIWLSPAYQRHSAFIAVHMYQGMPFEGYFRDLEAILREHGGRPHWGKWHSLHAEELAALYPRWGDFQELRQRLDPNGVFLNDYLRRLFEPNPPRSVSSSRATG